MHPRTSTTQDLYECLETLTRAGGGGWKPTTPYAIEGLVTLEERGWAVQETDTLRYFVTPEGARVLLGRPVAAAERLDQLRRSLPGLIKECYGKADAPIRREILIDLIEQLIKK